MSSLSKRKFYRTIVQIEILSETPYSSTDLEKINEDTTIGNQSAGVSIVLDSEEIDGKSCAEKLKAQGSDPDFFCLNIHGHDTEDAEDYSHDEEDEISGPRKLRD